MKLFKPWKTQTLLLLAVIGPGFITANVDNDAGGIYTYSFAGAQFGYKPLFTILSMTLALIVIQEMSARMGTCTGKGLSDLICKDGMGRNDRADRAERAERAERAPAVPVGLILSLATFDFCQAFTIAKSVCGP